MQQLTWVAGRIPVPRLRGGPRPLDRHFLAALGPVFPVFFFFFRFFGIIGETVEVFAAPVSRFFFFFF